MINVTARRLFLCAQPMDMRKGIDGLASIVLSQLQLNPSSGDIFIFVGRRASSLKALCWDGDGYWLCTRRLAEGRFLVPHLERRDGRPATLELSEVEWHLLLDGIVVRDRVLLRRHRRTLPEDHVPAAPAQIRSEEAPMIDVNPAYVPC
jgi:transposase